MSERTLVPIDDAMARLIVTEDYDAGNGPEPCVHTFLNGAGVLLGAHWSVTRVREEIEKYGVEEAGPGACSTGHCLVILRERTGPLFIEARP